MFIAIGFVQDRKTDDTQGRYVQDPRGIGSRGDSDRKPRKPA